MPRIKSLVDRVEIDTAKRSHNCQANNRHRIEKGDLRLKVRVDRTWEHYCRACAEKIISKDIAKLTDLQNFEPTIRKET